MIVKPTRGASLASKKAAHYLKTWPNTSAAELSKKFGISITTVRRAAWWKNRVAQPQTGEK